MMRAVLALTLSLVGAFSVHAAVPFDPFDKAGIDRKPGAQIPLDLPFKDEAGRTVTLRQLGRGKPILLAPVLHNCPNICGVTLGGLASAILAQPYQTGDDFSLVAFGIDPKETVEDAARSITDLRQRLPKLDAAGGIHALVGTSENVAAVTNALGYRYAFDPGIGQYAHIAAVATLTPDGRLSRWLYGVSPQPTDLRLALTEAGGGTIGSWADQLLLLCYHYDPVTGRYGSIIEIALRTGAGLTVAAIAGFIAFSVWREERRRREGASS